jgi:MtN3 and saliva related transmembrane protein
MSTVALGLFAAALTIVSFVAQVWQILRTRNTRSLWTPMWILWTVSSAVWSVYGVLQREWPIIIPNALCFLLAAFILMLKFLPRRKRNAVAKALLPRSR